MTKLSTGADSTLGEYLKLAVVFFGEESGSVKFLKHKISLSRLGENEEVIADESQMVHLLSSLN